MPLVTELSEMYEAGKPILQVLRFNLQEIVPSEEARKRSYYVEKIHLQAVYIPSVCSLIMIHNGGNNVAELESVLNYMASIPGLTSYERKVAHEFMRSVRKWDSVKLREDIPLIEDIVYTHPDEVVSGFEGVCGNIGDIPPFDEDWWLEEKSVPPPTKPQARLLPGW